jgi:hypothetical protein
MNCFMLWNSILLMKPEFDHPVKKFTTPDTSGSISMFTKKLPLDPNLSQLNLVHTPKTCLKIHFNIILPSICTSSKSPFLSGILNFCVLCFLSLLCVSNCANHYAVFLSCYLLSHVQIFFSASFPQTVETCSSLRVTDQFHTSINNGENCKF